MNTLTHPSQRRLQKAFCGVPKVLIVVLEVGGHGRPGGELQRSRPAVVASRDGTTAGRHRCSQGLQQSRSTVVVSRDRTTATRHCCSSPPAPRTCQPRPRPQVILHRQPTPALPATPRPPPTAIPARTRHPKTHLTSKCIRSRMKTHIHIASPQDDAPLCVALPEVSRLAESAFEHHASSARQPPNPASRGPPPAENPGQPRNPASPGTPPAQEPH
jgi:hypothetical protein